MEGDSVCEAASRELRFRAPAQPESWEGIRQATEFGPENIQPRHDSEWMGGQKPPESEDSLYLNIWTPEKKVVTPFPLWSGFTGIIRNRIRQSACL